MTCLTLDNWLIKSTREFVSCACSCYGR